MQHIVLNGDNLELLKKYPDNHFDAVVTDPPYGLGKEPNAVELMKDWVENGYHEIKGSGFMGKKWDAFVPQPLFWKEVFRVLKHGGHVLAFYGTRTFDWGVMAMRFAGFEVRDSIYWHYGSGFPKSHNVSLAIDKLRGAVGNRGKAFRTAGAGDRKDIRGKNGIVGMTYTNSSTEDAKVWEGWGSALKPASEPIVLARKPLEKGLSIAENVLKWGTGGINIDGCRVGLTNGDDSRLGGKGSWKTPNMAKNVYEGGYSGQEVHSSALGRFPANLIMSHHPECECKGFKKVKGQIDKPTNRTENGNTWDESNSGLRKNMPQNSGGFADENGQETIEDWNCVEGGVLISPCIYINGYEISIFNFYQHFDSIQQHRGFYHNSEVLYSHNKDKYSFLDHETFHDLGWKQLPSFRVGYPFLSRFYDALVQTFQVYDQLSFQQLNDALDVAYHFLELLHSHSHLDHDLLSKQNDSHHDSLAQHIYLNKEFYSVFLKKISYHNADILFQELAKNDVLDSTYENNTFEDFLSYLTKMGLNNSSILHLHRMLFCLSLQINFNQIYYKGFELPICPIKIMDEQSGISKSPNKVSSGGKTFHGEKYDSRAIDKDCFGDKGGASRFFYCAKASKSERNKGLEWFEEKESKKFNGGDFHSASTIANERTSKNFHPTVKPVKLMQYLVRLITPPNGLVLDPFCGSGTTGIACKLEGFNFIGMEQDPEYTKIAQARIENWTEDKSEIKNEKSEKDELPVKPTFIQNNLF